MQPEDSEQLISYIFLSARKQTSDDFDEGNGLVLPEYVLSELVHFEVPTPYIFELYNEQSGVWTHVTVREFTQPDNGACLVPGRVLQQLQIAVGDRIMLRRVRLPLAEQLTVRATPDPRDYAAFTSNLNRRIRQFICLTQGDVFTLQHAGRTHEVRITGVVPDLVHGVALIDEDETREVQIVLQFDRRNEAEAAAKRTRGSKSRTVLRLPDYDYSTIHGLSLENGAPKRVMWFMNWNQSRNSVDVLAVNPYSLLTRLTVVDKDCDVCGERLTGHPAEEFRFLPRTTETLWPLAGLAYHVGTGDERRDGVRLPSVRSLDLRHLECQLAFAARAFVDTGADYVLPENASEVPLLQTYPGQRVRDTLAWQQVPEPWLWALLLSQEVSFSVPGIGAESDDVAPLVRQFTAMIASLANKASEESVRAWAKTARTVLLDRIRSAYASSAAVELQRNAIDDDGNNLIDLKVSVTTLDQLFENDSADDAAAYFDNPNVEMTASRINPVLLRAASLDALNILKYTIEKYGTSDLVSRYFRNIYHDVFERAVRSNSYKIVRWWLNSGPTRIDYLSNLYDAVYKGASEVVSLLLEKGEFQQNDLSYILMQIIESHIQYEVPDEDSEEFPNGSTKNYLEIIKKLLEAGASPFTGNGVEFVNRVGDLMTLYQTPLVDYVDSLIRAVINFSKEKPTPNIVEGLINALTLLGNDYYRNNNKNDAMYAISFAWETVKFLLQNAPLPPAEFFPELLNRVVFSWSSAKGLEPVLYTNGVFFENAHDVFAKMLQLVGHDKRNSLVHDLILKIGVFFEFFRAKNSLDKAFTLFADFLNAYLDNADTLNDAKNSRDKLRLREYIDVFRYFHEFGLQFRPTEEVLQRMHPNIALLWSR